MATPNNKELLFAMQQVGNDYIDTLKRELIKDGKKSTGNLVNSLQLKIVKTKDGYATQILAADYLEDVDKGRKPGKMPPVSKITKWANKKGIRIPGANAKQVGFIIARSISKKGIKATNVLNDTKKKMLNNADEKITKAVVKDFENYIEKEFKDI